MLLTQKWVVTEDVFVNIKVVKKQNVTEMFRSVAGILS